MVEESGGVGHAHGLNYPLGGVNGGREHVAVVDPNQLFRPV